MTQTGRKRLVSKEIPDFRHDNPRIRGTPATRYTAPPVTPNHPNPPSSPPSLPAISSPPNGRRPNRTRSRSPRAARCLRQQPQTTDQGVSVPEVAPLYLHRRPGGRLAGTFSPPGRHIKRTTRRWESSPPRERRPTPAAAGHPERRVAVASNLEPGRKGSLGSAPNPRRGELP